MVSKSFIVYTFLLCFTASVDAHALINPALGVNGQGTRNDVQNPSTANPCGKINIAQTLDTSTALPVSSNGSISPTITDFNGGADGSRSIKTVQVDTSGTGNSFVAAQMLVNGDPNPTTAGTQPLTVQLPAGTTCTGGTSKNLCLVSFVTTAGFGNCLVASQGSTTTGNNAKGQPQGNNNTCNTTTSNNKTGNTTTSKNKTGNTTTGNNKTGKNKTGINNTSNNSTNTNTGDKNKTCNSAGSNANRRSASSKRTWSSRELVVVL